MKLFKKILVLLVLLVLFLILSAVVIYGLYFHGVIFTQEVELTAENIHASLLLTKGKNTETEEDDELLYGRGFFIAPNKVVCLTSHCLEGYDLKIADIDKNEYDVIDKYSYGEITILRTDRNNENEILYLYGVVNEDDVVNVHISSTPYIDELSACKVLDNHYLNDGMSNIICEGQIEGKAGSPIIDKHGRIIGITWGNSTDGKSFFAYSTYEILKNNPKLFFE